MFVNFSKKTENFKTNFVFEKENNFKDQLKKFFPVYSCRKNNKIEMFTKDGEPIIGYKVKIRR